MYLPCVSFHFFLTARILLLFTWYEHLTASSGRGYDITCLNAGASAFDESNELEHILTVPQ